MTAVGLPPRRLVRVGVQASSGIAVGTADRQVAFAGEGEVERSLVVGDEEPRAVVLQVPEQFGMAFQGRRLFTAVAGIQGRRGTQGIPGPAGGSAVQRTAGETLSALRAVFERDGEVHLLDPTDPLAPVHLFLGITVSAAAVGDPIVVQRSGTLDDDSFAWGEGIVFVGANGRLTQNCPVTGWEIVVGASPAPSRLNLDFDEPVLLAQD